MPRRGKRDHDEASMDGSGDANGFDLDFENILKQLKPKKDENPQKKKKLETLCKAQAATLKQTVQSSLQAVEERLNELKAKEGVDDSRRVLLEDSQRWAVVLTAFQDLSGQYEEAVRATQKTHEEQLKKQEAEFLQTLEEITAAYHSYHAQVQAEVETLRTRLRQQSTAIVKLL
ncbi:hypothetical protein PTSG_05207 [Salpingoeca rosetta]|uniref:Uncharacterized protein n=1 Tax=Salpingoeca rosetta (strain ATCC 50818 / BSB-021) TaxID=946362 RepID=F2UAT8_SALR5|nr:uncharacterized protein PTSG_05207 [Salpingoeca rosetta]EGD73504.1 hypothetical protein PTSG_05207 [Salpingoeca rosetta]|eukprot:XP_004993786.1 hypothetical protein PTSG_05207 [Salpingoeca rosetta]